jgi:uncharacterized protein with von Willebrand factor type A (vWA) domain
MKPPCEVCKPQKETLSSILGKEMISEIVYRLFNPAAGKDGKQTSGESLIEKLIKQFLEELSGEQLEEFFDSKLLRWTGTRSGKWFRDYLKHRKAKQKAWEKFLEMVKRGEADLSQISVEELLHHFLSQILEELGKEGMVDLKFQRDWLYGNVLVAYPEFTDKSEKIIAKKVLEEVFINIRGLREIGCHETEEVGWGVRQSYMLWDFDEQQHSYDLLDVQETLIKTALRDPVHMRISSEDLKARIPYHETSSNNVILIDASYSMRGEKFRGGIMAALAFRELLEREYKQDKLHVVAYNQRPKLLGRGEIVKLKPYGYTDIGQAVDFAVNLLSKEEGNRNIFLITDGEPTATNKRGQTPEESALKAAYRAGKADVLLNIVMLDRRPELRLICEHMARLNGRASVTYVDNPINLKEFMIKFFFDRRQSLNIHRVG